MLFSASGRAAAHFDFPHLRGGEPLMGSSSRMLTYVPHSCGGDSQLMAGGGVAVMMPHECGGEPRKADRFTKRTI